jgi:hypothetical protein
LMGKIVRAVAVEMQGLQRRECRQDDGAVSVDLVPHVGD